MKKLKKIITVLLPVMLIMTLSSPALAAEAYSKKEEVVYVMTDASGQAMGIYVVNIFGSGEITDYGDYSDVRLLNSNAPITQAGDMVTFTSSTDRVYYEGALESKQMPWDISIHYFMDGAEYSPEDIAGMSGALKIQMTIHKNPECNSTFFNHYALQATVTLDTECCTAIVAEGATEADAGRDKKLSYIILPGNDKDMTITANAVNFQMDPVEINGLLMDIGSSIDFDADSLDLSNYKDSISDLQEGAENLDDGADHLYHGAVGLQEGASGLADGTSRLSSGLSALNGNSNDLMKGAQKLVNAVFASATKELRMKLIAAGMSEAEASQLTLTASNYVSVIAELSGGEPTEPQIALAESTIRSKLAAMGLTDTAQQSVAMTLASNILSGGNASTVEAALSQAGAIMADAAFVQTAIATYSSSTDSVVSGTVASMVAALTSAPYNLDTATSTAVACTAIAMDAANPSAQITNAIAKVQNAGTVSAAAADSSSIRALCIAAVQEQKADAADEFAELKTQLDGVVSFLTGIEAYTSGVISAATGARDIASGASALASGANSLLDGAEKLADGTNELHTGTEEFDTDLTGNVQNKIDEVMDDYSNEGYTPVSFVSEKNTSVKSVQFVIKTAAVKVSETENTQEEPAETLTFWEKLLRLFGLY